MKRVRKPGESHWDIDFDDVFILPFGVAVVVVVVALIISGLWAVEMKCENDAAVAYNEQAVVFNAKPLEERRIIAEWIDDENVDPKTYLMSEKKLRSLFILESIHGAGGTKRFGLLYLAGFLAILSLVTFGGYWYKRDKKYYLCSLPFDESYGWVLFGCMFMGWPFLLASYICMRVQSTDAYKVHHALREKSRQEREELAKKEKAAVKRMAEDELAEKARALTRPQFPEESHRALVNFVLKDQAKAYASRSREAKDKVESAQYELQKAGASVQVAQRTLGEAQADLKRVEAICLSQVSRKQAEAEWMAIKEARGVSSINYNKRRQRLEIIIKVRVPYEGELYDFGDYCLIIDGTAKCNCREIRSGVKVNNTSTSPLYHLSGKQFCFGSSLYTIENYLGNGRYAEAITLVVECLHSVNSNDVPWIPHCFRKVSTIEKAERRILLRNKFKFLKGA